MPSIKLMLRQRVGPEQLRHRLLQSPICDMNWEEGEVNSQPAEPVTLLCLRIRPRIHMGPDNEYVNSCHDCAVGFCLLPTIRQFTRIIVTRSISGTRPCPLLALCRVAARS